MPQRDTPIPALLPSDNDGCQFVVYGDCCSGIAGTRHEKNFASVNRVLGRLNPAPEFVVFLGDHIQGYTNDLAKLRAQWRHLIDVEFEPVRNVTSTIIHVPGNHDTYDTKSAAMWREVFPEISKHGPPHQQGRAHYVRRGSLLMVNLATPAEERSGDAQFNETEWLDCVLGDHADAEHKLVFGHHPAFAVNGYDEHPTWCLPPDEALSLWAVLSTHKVIAYICSHIIAFDVQHIDAVLQITSGGAGTNYGPGGFMPGTTEYHHLVQLALDRKGLRLQVIDIEGQIRETTTWPLPHDS